MPRATRCTLVLLSLVFASWPAPGSEPAAKSRNRPRTRTAEPKIVPAQGRKPSEFLQRPGEDRYDPGGTDWLHSPPWRQTTFFGIRARGQFFVYVVDCSESMVDEERLVRAKRELRRSVLALQPPQRFKVVFYNDRPLPMPGDLPRPADVNSKNQLIHWLRLIEPDGKTDPRGAMGLALGFRPDAVFLLSDGEFPDGTAAWIARRNPHRVPVHCVDLSGGLGGEQLQKIARESGGEYRSRPAPEGSLP